MKQRVVITAASIPSLPRGVKLRFDKARDVWVLLGPERIFNPNPIALEIIKRCDGTATVEAIVDDLAATFKADRGVIEQDVTALLQDLADKGIMAG